MKLRSRSKLRNAGKLREIQSVYNELKQLMKPEEIGPGPLKEMEEFEGRTPADLISKGETGLEQHQGGATSSFCILPSVLCSQGS